MSSLALPLDHIKTALGIESDDELIKQQLAPGTGTDPAIWRSRVIDLRRGRVEIIYRRNDYQPLAVKLATILGFRTEVLYPPNSLKNPGDYSDYWLTIAKLARKLHKPPKPGEAAPPPGPAVPEHIPVLNRARYARLIQLNPGRPVFAEVMAYYQNTKEAAEAIVAVNTPAKIKPAQMVASVGLKAILHEREAPYAAAAKIATSGPAGYLVTFAKMYGLTTWQLLSPEPIPGLAVRPVQAGAAEPAKPAAPKPEPVKSAARKRVRAGPAAKPR